MNYSLEKYEEYAVMAEKDPAALIAMLKDKDTRDDDLVILAEAAGIIGDESKIVPVLIKLLEHKNPDVREGAVYGIGCFMGELATDALLDVIAHDESETVKDAARSVPAVEYLLDTLGSPITEGELDGLE